MLSGESQVHSLSTTNLNKDSVSNGWEIDCHLNTKKLLVAVIKFFEFKIAYGVLCNFSSNESLGIPFHELI